MEVDANMSAQLITPKVETILRAMHTCPLCNNAKDVNLLVCWTCYRAWDVRNGVRPSMAQILVNAATEVQS